MERKTFDLVGEALSEEGTGSFAGFASCYGVKDSQGDIVVKGAYAQTLPQFIERGFISWGHDWNNPVATIKTAREEPSGLYIEADFHSDPQSQQARVRTMERLQRGKFMGLSIGFAIDPGGAEQTKDARLLKSLTLYETGLVTVPACAPAGVTAAKAMGGEAPEGSYEDLSEDIAEAYTARFGGYAWTVATFANHAILCVRAAGDQDMMGDPLYLDMPYAQLADGTITLGTPTEVEQSTTYVPVDDAKGMVVPLYALTAELKAGRRHSKPTQQRYAVMMTHATALVDHIGSLQAESAPKPDGKAAPPNPGASLYADLFQFHAREAVSA